MIFSDSNPAVSSLRILALAEFDGIMWRHHGIGCLQGYLSEGGDVELRLHVWHASLVKPGMDESGDIHDHRFRMVSHVLSGIVAHEEVYTFSDPDGDHAMLSLTHARAAKDTAYHGPTTELPGRFAVSRSRMVCRAGESYHFQSQRFHRSPVLPGVAVTLIEKHDQVDTPARILYPIAKPPIMAFGHEMDASLVASVLAQAKQSLLPAVRQ